MIQGKDIICFCNDWKGDPLSKHQIVMRLSKKNRILWVNSTGMRNPTLSAHDVRRAARKVRDFLRGCREVAENISVFSPLVVPFHGSERARRFNRWLLSWSLRRAMRKLRFKDPITLTFNPTSADVAGELGEKMLIYYCVDEYSQFTGTDAVAMLSMEERLIRKSNIVVVSAGRLLAAKSPMNRNTHLITHGVDVEHFRKACLPETAIPEDVAGIKGPIIGFFGLIEDWVDQEVIRGIATARPQWSFVMLGDVRTDVSALKALPNVHFFGRKPYSSLPGYCKAFDAAILPFVWNDLTMAANPLKMREYIAAGLPVVATPLPEVMRLKHVVNTARTADEYLAHFDGLIASGRTGPRMEVSRTMDVETWDRKVDDLSALIEAVGAHKAAA